MKSRRRPTAALAMAALLLVLLAAGPEADAAAPAPVSDPALSEWPSGLSDPRCGSADARLVTNELSLDDDGDGYTDRCELVVQQVDGHGERKTVTLLDTALFHCRSAQMACRGDGSAVVVASNFDEPVTWSLWEVDAEGAVTSGPRSIVATRDCRWPDSILLAPDGDVLALEACADQDWRTRLAIRRFPLAGGDEPTPLWLTERSDGTTGTGSPTAAFDSAGNLFVAWNVQDDEDGDGNYRSRVFGRFVTSARQLVGNPLRLDVFDPASAWTGRVLPLAEGLFTAFWTSQPEGGTVARTVSLDPDVFPYTTTTTTTLPPPPEAPLFSPSRSVGRDSSDAPEAPVHDAGLRSLRGDGRGSLLLRRERGASDNQEFYYDDPISRTSLYLSPDAGGRWGAAGQWPVTRWQYPGPFDAVAPTGTALSAVLQSDWRSDDEYWGVRRRLEVRRSSDAGRTWAAPSVVSTRYCGDCDEEYFHEAALAGDAHGTWMIAAMTNNNGTRNIDVNFSTDDGLSWKDGTRLWQGDTIQAIDPTELWSFAEYPDQLSAAAGKDGPFGLAWRNFYNGDLHVAVAADAGSPWTIREIRAPWDGNPYESSPSYPYGRPSLAVTSDGAWLLAWQEKIPPPPYGGDSEIYLARSTDDGQTWSDPVPLNVYAAIDHASEEAPSLAADVQGRVLAVWSSHDSLGGTIGTDADIVSSISTDGGLTWSPPAPVDAAAEPDARQDIDPQAVASSPNRWTVAWTTTPLETGWRWDNSDVGVRVAVAGSSCGDGLVDDGEQCDDGNRIDGDGCDSNCSLPSCGNEILDEGEACDAPAAAVSCTSACEVPVCGDGERDAWTEQCDDGNGDDSDACPGNCLRAHCGDGFTASWEECDDANTDDNDACHNDCRAAFCGDGRVLAAVETCDDGDRWAGNACTDQCLPATCGDGRLWLGVEECDDPDGKLYGGACGSDCRFTGMCSDANASGLVTASDALMILRSAVGLEESCPLSRCDVDGNGRVTATDAWRTLRLATGLSVQLRCSGSEWAVFTLDDPRVFGVLMFEVDPTGLAIDFLAPGATRPTCETLAPDVIFASNVSGNGKLTLAVLSLSGVDGPAALARCRVYLRHDTVVDAPLKIEMIEYSGLDGNNLYPSPRIAMTMQ